MLRAWGVQSSAVGANSSDWHSSLKAKATFGYHRLSNTLSWTALLVFVGSRCSMSLVRTLLECRLNDFLIIIFWLPPTAMLAFHLHLIDSSLIRFGFDASACSFERS